MSKSTKKDPFPNPMAMFESMMPRGVDSDALSAFGDAGNAWMKGMAGFHEELATFFNTRLQHDAELTRALAGCTSWQEAIELQQNWMRETAEEYTRAAQTLTTLSTQMMTESWSRLGAPSQPSKKSQAG